MKVLFVAVFTPGSTNISQSDGFKKCGWEVIEFNYREMAYHFGETKRDRFIVDYAMNQKVDLVVFSKCNEVRTWVVDECNKITKTALWYMDTMNENYNSSLVEKIRKCNYVFCSIWESYENAKKINPKTYFLHEGYDHLSNFPVETEPLYDVSFIGVLRNKRIEYHQALNFPVIQNAYGAEHSKIVSGTKINLNFTEGGTSDRTYKVLASKGFLLTEPYPQMENDFKIGVDLDVFTNVDELKEKIDYYLTHEDERKAIAENGYKTVQKFDRINWAKNLLEIVNG